MHLQRNVPKGFSLPEILIYVAVLAVVVLVVCELFLWLLNVGLKTRVMQAVTDNADLALAVLSREIRASEKIYLPTSVLDSDSGQLSLQTSRYLPDNETQSYIDFYLCEERLCFRKEDALPQILTSDDVEVKKLRFSRVQNAVAVVLEVASKNPHNLPSREAAITLRLVAALRQP
jgi:hypothetical protein